MPATPEPFEVRVSDEDLADLKARLANARPLPEQLEDIAPWEDGTDLGYFKGFLEYWKDGYDWRKWEAKLNGIGKQYKLTIEGVDVHFVHEPSASRPDAVPLLLIHGWPGSYFEFYKLIPLLRRDGRFHIVAPSLPGYGWSSAPTRRGCGATSIARMLDALMASLGYSKYMAQGGDWGGIVCRALAKHHPSTCRAVHVNMAVAVPRMSNPRHLLTVLNVALAPKTPVFLSRRELEGVQAMREFQKRESAYQKIQGTKPQTLAYALHDSPVGLSAWILEKLKGWSDCGADPEEALTKDEMLTNISIYWFGGRIASSMRLYKETMANRKEMGELFSGYATTPTGVAVFPKEVYRPPRCWVASAFNLQHWTEAPRGGHFAALEQPELLAADFCKFADLAQKKGWV